MKNILKLCWIPVMLSILVGCGAENQESKSQVAEKEAPKGMLRITTKPLDAKVYINGERKGSSPSEVGQSFMIKLSEGEYTVKALKADGEHYEYVAEKTDLFIAPDTMQTINLKLKRQETAAGTLAREKKEARLAKEKAEREVKLAKEKAEREVRLAKEKAEREARLEKERAALETSLAGIEVVMKTPYEQRIKKFKVNNVLGTVYDAQTNLTWMICSLGQKWSGTTCEGDAKTFEWKEAVNKAKSLTYASRNHWRLPYKTELFSLVYCSTGWKDSASIASKMEKGCNGYSESPAIFSKVFSNTKNRSYWSSSAYDSSNAWAVGFNRGTHTFGNKRYMTISRVRLVRSGQ